MIALGNGEFRPRRIVGFAYRVEGPLFRLFKGRELQSRPKPLTRRLRLPFITSILGALFKLGLRSGRQDSQPQSPLMPGSDISEHVAIQNLAVRIARGDSSQSARIVDGTAHSQTGHDWAHRRPRADLIRFAYAVSAVNHALSIFIRVGAR